ncbi:MAG: hypothetical protein AAB299_03855, partial [Thermodesulfobacteriota bacterium]
MAKINFGGVWEEVVTSEEFTLSRAQEVLKGETVAVLGYGVQGPGQALNLRDNGIRVIVGQREGGKTWQKAVDDGFVPGKTLFPVEEAAKRGTVIEYLLSDAGQAYMTEQGYIPAKPGVAAPEGRPAAADLKLLPVTPETLLETIDA